MQRLIIVLSCILAITLGVTNIAFAQAAAAIAEGEKMAAAGDYKGAISVYEKLIQSHPESHEAHAHLGGMQLLEQRYSDAVKSFQRAITLGDEGTGSFIGMGMAYLHMGQMGPARAAFVEARARGLDNPTSVDEIIAWIDSRKPAANKQHP